MDAARPLLGKRRPDGDDRTLRHHLEQTKQSWWAHCCGLCCLSGDEPQQDVSVDWSTWPCWRWMFQERIRDYDDFVTSAQVLALEEESNEKISIFSNNPSFIRSLCGVDGRNPHDPTESARAFRCLSTRCCCLFVWYYLKWTSSKGLSDGRGCVCRGRGDAQASVERHVPHAAVRRTSQLAMA